MTVAERGTSTTDRLVGPPAGPARIVSSGRPMSWSNQELP